MLTLFLKGKPLTGRTILRLVFWFILATVMTYAFITTEHVIKIEPLPAQPPEQWHSFMAEVTAYTSSVEETDDTPFISADGNTVYDGLIACPRKFPFGTIVVVAGDQYRCGDRMAKRFDHRFDIWKQSKAEAYEWGVRMVEVKVQKFSTGSSLTMK